MTVDPEQCLFVREVIKAMAIRPLMYAQTRESFILTLVSMIEVLFFRLPPHTTELMKRLCGPGNCLVDGIGAVEATWAQERCGIALLFIVELMEVQ